MVKYSRGPVDGGAEALHLVEDGGAVVACSSTRRAR